MARATPTPLPLIADEPPIPEDLYPQCLAWDAVAGEPIERVLSCLRDLNEWELKKFFNSTSKDFQNLTPAELLCGQRERHATLNEGHAMLLQLPRSVRLDMVCGARFRDLVFRQLADTAGAATDDEKRKLLQFQRMGSHLVEISTAVLARSNDAKATAVLNDLRRYWEAAEKCISEAQSGADPSVPFK